MRDDGSAVQLDETSDERQADAEPALGAVQRALPLHEHVEDRWEQLRRNPDPGVLDREHGVVALHRRETREWSRPRGVYLIGVRDQVHEDLLEAVGVSLDPNRLGADLDVPIQSGVRRHAGDRALHRLRHVERMAIQSNLPGRDALDVEQVVDEAGEVGDLSRDHLTGLSGGAAGLLHAVA